MLNQASKCTAGLGFLCLELLGLIPFRHVVTAAFLETPVRRLCIRLESQKQEIPVLPVLLQLQVCVVLTAKTVCAGVSW